MCWERDSFFAISDTRRRTFADKQQKVAVLPVQELPKTNKASLPAALALAWMYNLSVGEATRAESDRIAG